MDTIMIKKLNKIPDAVFFFSSHFFFGFRGEQRTVVPPQRGIQRAIALRGRITGGLRRRKQGNLPSKLTVHIHVLLG